MPGGMGRAACAGPVGACRSGVRGSMEGGSWRPGAKCGPRVRVELGRVARGAQEEHVGKVAEASEGISRAEHHQQGGDAVQQQPGLSYRQCC